MFLWNIVTLIQLKYASTLYFNESNKMTPGYLFRLTFLFLYILFGLLFSMPGKCDTRWAQAINKNATSSQEQQRLRWVQSVCTVKYYYNIIICDTDIYE